MRRPRSTALTAIFAVLVSTLTFTAAATVTSTSANADVIQGAWTAVGTPFSTGGKVYALAQEATGTGTVYAGGFFTNAGGNASADYIASIDPSNGAADWQALTPTPLGSGYAYTGVYSIAPVSGSATVFIGGNFNNATAATRGIVSWDGSTTSNFAGLTNGGLGLPASQQADFGVDDLVAIDATTTYMVGYFADAGGTGAADNAALYRNGTWTAPGTAVTAAKPVNAIAYRDATSTVIGGQFTTALSPAFDRVAQWNCNGPSTNCATTNTVTSVAGDASTTLGLTTGLVAHLMYAGADLYAGGNFTATNAGTPVTVNGLAKWNGTAWGTVGDTSAGVGLGGTNYVIETMALSPGATANTGYLYIGGSFTSVNGVAANNIARMDLATGTWSSLGCGTYNGVSGGAVRGILPQADNSVIVGGHFTSAGSNSDAPYVARYTPGADNCPAASPSGGGGGGSSPAPGTPDAPQNVTVSFSEAGNGSITISWNPPASDGGSALVQYQGSTADGRGKCYTNPSTLSCTIAAEDIAIPFRRPQVSSDMNVDESRWQLIDTIAKVKNYLMESAMYRQTSTNPWNLGAYARARNSVGWGALGFAPPPSPYDPVYPPGVPTNVVATAGWNKMTVDWTAPTYTGTYPITNYLVTSTPGNKACISTLADAKLTQCTYTDLTPGTKYTFVVQALNGGGWGDRSTASNVASPYNLKITKYSRKEVKKLFFFKAGSLVQVSGGAPGYSPKDKLYAWYKVGSDGNWILSKDAPIVGTDQKFSWERQFDKSHNSAPISIVISAGAPGSKYDKNATYKGAGQNYSNTITAGNNSGTAKVIAVKNISTGSGTSGRNKTPYWFVSGSIVSEGIPAGSDVTITMTNQRTGAVDNIDKTLGEPNIPQDFSMYVPEKWKNDTISLTVESDGVKSSPITVKAPKR